MKKSERADLRARLADILDEVNDESLRELLTDGLSAEKLVWAYCPDCKKKVRVDYPDLDKRAKFLDILLNQAKGRPTETHKHEVNVRAVPVTEMSEEELDAIIEGKARELPA